MPAGGQQSHVNPFLFEWLILTHHNEYPTRQLPLCLLINTSSVPQATDACQRLTSTDTACSVTVDSPCAQSAARERTNWNPNALAREHAHAAQANANRICRMKTDLEMDGDHDQGAQ